jgi:hypothetical protein
VALGGEEEDRGRRRCNREIEAGERKARGRISLDNKNMWNQIRIKMKRTEKK